jgi:hypothetical protein
MITLDTIDYCTIGQRPHKMHQCHAESTHFFLILNEKGGRTTSSVIATCDDHVTYCGLASWHAYVEEISRNEAIITIILNC